MALGLLLACTPGPRKGDSSFDAGGTEDTEVEPNWSAHGWEMAWVVRAGGDKSWDGWPGDMGFGVCPAPDGGVFVTGYTYSEDALFGEGTENEISYLPPEEGLIYVARYDEGGTPLWVSRASTAGIGGNSCFATADGGVVIGGYLCNHPWYGSNVFGAGEPNEVDLDLDGQRGPFLAGYGADGSFEWITVGDDPDGYGIAGTASSTAPPGGGICSSGMVLRPFTFRNGEESVTVFGTELEASLGAMTHDGFLARFTEDGTPLWARELNGLGYIRCHAAVALEDGSCALACAYDYGGTMILDGGESGDLVFEHEEGAHGGLVALYSPEGDLVWAEELVRSDGRLYISSLVADRDSSLVLGGTFRSTIRFNQGTEIEAQGSDHFLSRLTPGGEIDWIAVAQGPEGMGHGAEMTVVSISPEGDIAVAGGFSGIKTFGLGEENEMTLESGAGKSFNGYAALYSAEGLLRWAIPVALGPKIDNCLSTHGEQRALSVAFDGPGVIYITGVFITNAAFGTSPDQMVTMQTFGCTDMFLMKLERIEAPR